MKLNKLFSLLKLSMLLIMLIIYIKAIKTQNEMEELESNFLTGSNDTKETKPNHVEAKKSIIIPEINDIEGLKKFFAENKKFIFEVYSSSCPHCIKLAPELDKLALEYKEKVKFIKTDGRDSYAYRSIVKIDHFPSLFIYDNGNLIELGGALNYHSVKKYIDEKYFFKCEKIESISSLKAKIIELSHKRFFIGILDSALIKNSFEIFYKLMYQNMLIVENCFYFAYSVKNKSDNKNNEATNFLSFYSNLNNFILINNSEKIQVFEDLEYIVNYPLQLNKSQNYNKNNDFQIAISSLNKSAKNYFMDNSFPNIFALTKDKINLIFQFPKLRAIFAFDKNSKNLLLKYLSMFAAQRKNVEFYNIILFDLEDSKEFEEEEKMYLYFTRVPGIHFTNQNFENIFYFNLESLEINKINEFAYENYAKYKSMLEPVTDNLSGKTESKATSNNQYFYEDNKLNKANIVDNNNKINAKNFGVEKKFVTAKIVEKLDKANYNDMALAKQTVIDKDFNANNFDDNLVINKSNLDNNKGFNYEKNKLTEDFVKDKKQNLEGELNKHVESILVEDNKIESNKAYKSEQFKKHDYAVNKIKVLFIYLVVYSVIYYFFYLRISKRDESKYN